MEKSSYSQIIEDSIRLHFERNGTLDEMRSGLHVKLLKMMRGESELKKDEPLCGGDMKQRGLIQLLNHLVVDYFAWYGYKHTIETFSLETGDQYKIKPHEQLRREFGDQFGQEDLPILLQMVMKQVKKVNRKSLPKTPQQENRNPKLNAMNTVVKDIPPEGSLDKAKVLPTPKLLQPVTPCGSPKLLSASPFRKIKVRQTMAGALAVGQEKHPLPRMKTKPCSKSDNSDNSDKLHKLDKSDKSDKSEKLDKLDKLDKSVKLDKLDKLDKSDKSDKLDKLDKLNKLDKSAKSDKLDKSDKSDKPDKSNYSTADSGADYGLDESNTSSDDSDEFAEIPNRYYYREDEPPEQAYPYGAGEEGPCETPSRPNLEAKILPMQAQCSPQSTWGNNSKLCTLFQSYLAVHRSKYPMQQTSDEDSD